MQGTIEAKKKTLMELLRKKQVIKTGKFLLSSGKESDYYVDMKKAITQPEILKIIAEIINEMIKDDRISKIAGPALGAVPLATAISLESQKPLLMIRKEKKGYGTSKLIEGELKQGDKVIVVEDVTTTGNSLLKAVKAIQENGGKVERAFVIVDRSEGAIEILKNNEIDLEPLILVEDFFE